MKYIVPIFIVLLLASCSKSLVYSPSINLPNEPLKEKEIDFQGGAELLPEARPEELEGNQTTFGINGQLSYGFTDNFSLSFKGWADIEGREGWFRSGYSLNAQFSMPINENSRFLIIPRIGMALHDDDISGYGIGTTVLYQQALSKNFSWYGGLGLIWGFHHLEYETNQNNERRIPMGFGIVGNLGIGWQLTKNIRLNFELSPIYQINGFDENEQMLLSPTIGVGYTLNKD